MALAEPFSGAHGTLAEAGDPELLKRAIDGERGAFEALYTRHADAAFRTACATAGNRHDAADATAEAFAKLFQRIADGRLGPDVPFRGYLLATVRNAALDQHRAHRRRTPTEDDHVFDIDRLTHATSDESDPVVRSEEAVMITRAFGELPERWRSVLWLTEVEGLAPGDAAEHLGTTANNTAQLAHRARARLRERYLTAHVDNTELPPDCQFATERLAAHASGALGKRDTAKVADHLEGCADCTERLALVEELGSTLRRAIVPLPLALAGSAGAAKVIASAGVGGAAGVGAASAGSAASVGGRVLSMPRWAHRAAAAGAAATLAGGVLALFTGVGDDDPAVPREVALERPSGSTTPPVTRPSSEPPDEQARSVDGSIDFADGFRPLPPADRQPTPGSTDPGSAPTPPPTSDGDRGQDGEPGAEPLGGGVVEANMGGTFGGESGGVTLGVGGGETGVQLGPVVVGDEPEVPEDDGLLVEVGGELLPPTRIELP